MILPDGQVVEVQNTAADPTGTFQFRLQDLEPAIATWHTHPKTSANLSIDDWWFFKSWPGIAHFIICADDCRCYVVVNGLVVTVDEADDLLAWLPG